MKSVVLLLALAAFSTAESAVPTPGQPAPAFRATDVDGKPVSLSDFRGRTVVLSASRRPPRPRS